jgi:phosphoribosylformylglycinamidine synthase
LASLPKLHEAVARMIRDGYVASCHDVSEGGAIVAAAEMCIASGMGMVIDGDSALFEEGVGQYLVEETGSAAGISLRALVTEGISCEAYGLTMEGPTFAFVGPDRISQEIEVDELRRAWRGTLDW